VCAFGGNDKDLNHANRIILVDPIIQAFGKKRRLPAIDPRNKASGAPKSRENHITRGVFTQPQPGRRNC
jgi:hypothetical protein